MLSGKWTRCNTLTRRECKLSPSPNPPSPQGLDWGKRSNKKSNYCLFVMLQSYVWSSSSTCKIHTRSQYRTQNLKLVFTVNSLKLNDSIGKYTEAGASAFKVTVTLKTFVYRIDCAIYLIISKLEQGGCRIRSRRQNEDEWRTAVGISKCFAKVKRWWLNKPLSKLSGNKVLDCGRHLKWKTPVISTGKSF